MADASCAVSRIGGGCGFGVWCWCCAAVRASAATCSTFRAASSCSPTVRSSTPPPPNFTPAVACRIDAASSSSGCSGVGMAGAVADRGSWARAHWRDKPAMPLCDRLRCRSRRQLPASPPALRAHAPAYACEASHVHMHVHVHMHMHMHVRMLDVALCAFVWTLGGRTSNPSKGVASLERPSVPVYLSRWPVPELGRYSQRSLPAVVRSGMCPLTE